MRVHSLHHVPFEGLGSIAGHLHAAGHQLSDSQLYAGEALPPLEAVDLLIVMGGPMGVSDDERFPWLQAERDYIAAAIAGNKRVLGICLGAQLIASALGAAVTRNSCREIGWHEIETDPALAASRFHAVFPAKFEAFHWHGDTFALPADAIPLGASTACARQGFLYDERVVALQFHLETTADSAAALIEHCRDELDGSRHVQDADAMMADPARFARINHIMAALLDTLTQPR